MRLVTQEIQLENVAVCLVSPDLRELTPRVPVVHGEPTRFAATRDLVEWVYFFQGDNLIRRMPAREIFGGRFVMGVPTEIHNADMIRVSGA